MKGFVCGFPQRRISRQRRIEQVAAARSQAVQHVGRNSETVLCRFKMMCAITDLMKRTADYANANPPYALR